MSAWKAHHRRLCKPLQVYTASPEYGALSSSDRLHFLLLAHLLSEYGVDLLSAFVKQEGVPEDLSNSISTLFSLLPQTNYQHVMPNLPPDVGGMSFPTSLVTHLSSRFANNNFTIHSSRMIVFAHGIFPSVSRSFNHSCVPSAVPVYSMASGSRHMTLDIRLIRDMKPGEEVSCLPPSMIILRLTLIFTL